MRSRGSANAEGQAPERAYPIRIGIREGHEFYSAMSPRKCVRAFSACGYLRASSESFSEDRRGLGRCATSTPVTAIT